MQLIKGFCTDRMIYIGPGIQVHLWRWCRGRWCGFAGSDARRSEEGRQYFRSMVKEARKQQRSNEQYQITPKIDDIRCKGRLFHGDDMILWDIWQDRQHTSGGDLSSNMETSLSNKRWTISNHSAKGVDTIPNLIGGTIVDADLGSTRGPPPLLIACTSQVVLRLRVANCWCRVDDVMQAEGPGETTIIIS